TTGLDANEAELVGLSFSYKENKAFYIPMPADRQEAIRKLNLFSLLFEQEDIVWIAHNLKYDLLVLKWYGFELKGKSFDTLLAHYVIDPEGKRSMDFLSEQFL